MPGFDRTGPRGEGPMTGGGRGMCNPAGGTGGYGGYGLGRGGMPWGGGRGRGFGGGRGWGRGFGRGWFGAGAAAPIAAPTADDERRYLADQLSHLENEVRAIKDRLSQLDKPDEKEPT